jgi:hypothetical protein
MKLLSSIAALAVLAGSAMAGTDRGCGLVVLDYGAAGALNLVGNSSIQVPTKAVYVNSNSSSALLTTGTALLDAPEVHVVGQAVFNGHSSCSGTVIQSGVPFADPLSNLAMPTSSSALATFGGGSYNGGNQNMLPGRYTGQVIIGGNARVMMAPGIYHFDNGLRINSGDITGVGVCLVIHGGAMELNGSSSLLLVPPTDGMLAGVVLCQPSSNTNDVILTGGANTDIWGSIYAPGARLNLVGNSAAVQQPAMVGDLVVGRLVRITGIGALKIGHANLMAVSLPRLPLAD